MYISRMCKAKKLQPTIFLLVFNLKLVFVCIMLKIEQ